VIHRLLTVAALSGLVVAGAAACASKEKSTAPALKVAVTATDTACTLDRTELHAGVNEFVVTNGGSKVTEFYVFQGESIKGEVENIGPGVTRSLHVELAAGDYTGVCKPGMAGDGIRVPLRVTGDAVALTADVGLAQAVRDYREYVEDEADQLLAQTTAFANAIKAHDIGQAKKLYPVARTHWERIEPVAESFGDLDPKIDAREGDLEPGAQWTGFHRIEKDLWVSGDISLTGPLADQLVVDVTSVVAQASTVQLSPVQLANGAKELLDEVATSKITGEEDRYSHTDMWDFAANVEGAKKVVEALRPVLAQREPALLADLDTRFAGVEALLAAHRVGDGYQLYTELARDQIKKLSDAINGLAEPLSRLGAAVVG
jgi:iron uptake system component EfeO